MCKIEENNLKRKKKKVITDSMLVLQHLAPGG